MMLFENREVFMFRDPWERVTVVCFLLDHTPLCWVLLRCRQYKPDLLQREDHRSSGTAAGEREAAHNSRLQVRTPDANEALRANDLHVKSLQKCDRQSCGAIRANWASWKIGTLADIRAAWTNQELALAVMWLRAEAENPKQQWRTN